jgi:hypothetical protein
MPFPLSIRDRGHFPQQRLKLELRLCFIVVGRTDGIGWAGAFHVLTLLGLLGHNAGRA